VGKRIGIVTSGGDAPGMNAAIRAVFRCVKSQDPSNEVVLFKNGFRGVAGRLEANMDVDVQRKELRDILNRGGTCIGTGRVRELLPVDPDAPDAPERTKARQAFLDVASVNLYQLGLDGLVVIGGDGSYRGAHTIAQAYRDKFDRPMRVVGIPATIDNDIHLTDYTIGFDTALTNTVDALRKIRDTVESHRRAVILEVMGNTSGWLALTSGIAGGASTILVPEIAESYDARAVVDRCVAALRGDYRYFIVVMAEGVREAVGDEGYGLTLARAIEADPRITKALGHTMSARHNIIGHLARGGTPSAFDNVLAARFGKGAAEALLSPEPMLEDGSDDAAVALHGRDVVRVSLHDVVAHGPRLVTREDELYRLSQDLTVTADQAF
jgi:6-phosphofructokinase 1